MRRLLLVILLCLPGPRHACAQELTVAAASDLQVALPEVISRFERATGVRVQPVFGSSGNIAAQIQNGAPYDVFLSADIEYPRRLIARGLATREALAGYARGRVVLWVRNESALDVKRGLGALAGQMVRRIAIANPEHAPYGRAAVAALRHAGAYDQVRTKLVLGENISQAAQFALSGNADAGIIALSLALGPALRNAGRYVVIPSEFHPPIEQAAVWLTRAKDPAAARRFVEFLRQPATAQYLRTMGFDPAS
jgi:molybdate transport system substrate-binding protein